MTKNTLFVIAAICMIMPGTLYASCSQYSPSNTEISMCEMNAHDDSACAQYNTQSAYKSSSGKCYVLNGCNRCNTGYTRVLSGYGECTAADLGNNYYECQCNCSNCTSDTTWSAAGTGYQKKVTRTCSCSSGSPQCTTSTSYRCAAGYYGSSSNGTSGCTKCPDSGNSSEGSTRVTSCCLPSGSAFSDTTGTGSFTAQCCYTN